jgi:hypothetical protein
MPKRLLIAAGEAADTAGALPFGVRELIEAADQILVVTPALPTRFDWLASATDKARFAIPVAVFSLGSSA